MNESSQCGRPCGRREHNRRRTRRGIEDAALELMAARGFDAVTVEDVCAAAEVSRRTFFNYFESKDEVVLGRGLLIFDEADAERFRAAGHADPLRALLGIVEDALTGPPDSDDDLADPMARQRRLHGLRRRIIDSDPRLLGLAIAAQADVFQRITAVLEQVHAADPATRRAPGIPAAEEAALGAALIREAMWMATTRPGPRAAAAGDHPLLDAARTITRFTQEIPW